MGKDKKEKRDKKHRRERRDSSSDSSASSERKRSHKSRRKERKHFAGMSFVNAMDDRQMVLTSMAEEKKAIQQQLDAAAAAAAAPPAPLPAIEPVANTRIYVGNINFEANEDAVKDVLSKHFGPVRSLQLREDPMQQRHRGFCFVEFESASSATAALKSPPNTIAFGGMYIRINLPSQLQGGPASGEVSANEVDGFRDDGPPGRYLTTNAARFSLASRLAANKDIQLPASPLDAHGGSTSAPPPPSRVVTLGNMVGSLEDIDDDFIEDIRSECGKVGPVKNVQVHVEKSVDGQSKINVLVEFYDPLSADNCVKKMNGRFFAQRRITCGTLSMEAYDKVRKA